MPSRYPLRPRRGATLVELLVALVLLDMSLLSLVGMSALAVRHVGDAGRQNRAAIAVTRRLEWLSSQPCATAVTGSALLEPGMQESWMSAPIPGGQEVVDSIEIRGRHAHSLVVRSRVAC